MTLKGISSGIWSVVILAGCLTVSCGKPGPGGLFKKRSPHQTYAQRLKDAGFERTAMGKAWLVIADSSLRKPASIAVPYKETGYFPSDRVEAAAFRFEAKEGEKLTVRLSKKPAEGFEIYLDLFNEASGDEPGLVGFADTSSSDFTYNVDDTGFYLLRLQPELLRGGEYTMTITNGPSLAYPIKATGSKHIKSFWGDGRDAGMRKHEGIDLFAPFHTPVVAAAEGVVSRVNENRLGGKVVWLRPAGTNYSLYYAHLDSQLVSDGQRVSVGDTLGLMGNTGNARSTPPHLHFGIYTFGGAVDPLPFVKPEIKKPDNVQAPLDNLNMTVRSENRNSRLFSSPDRGSESINLTFQTVMLVNAASGNMYKTTLPDGRSGYISSDAVRPAVKPLRQYPLAKDRPLLEQPLDSAARKRTLTPGNEVNILGQFGDYYFVSDQEGLKGWVKK